MDRIGPVVIVDEVVFAAREVTKADARPGGYEAVGGHGGIVADMGGEGAPQVTFVPARKHTHTSEVRMTSLPAKVVGVAGSLGDGVRAVDVPVKDGKGGLPDSAMPRVTFTRYGRYTSTETGPADNPDVTDEVEILARIEANLAGAPLAGFVAEGKAPFGGGTPTSDAALQVAVYCGMPVVRVGRGSPGGMVPKQDPLSIAGNNLSATKARILLMACLLKLGALPPAADPYHPTPAEADRTRRALEAYQAIFDTH